MSLINKIKRKYYILKRIVCFIIDDILKNIRNIIIWTFLTVVAIIGVACFVNIPIEYDENMMIEYNDYIINKRTFKIHIVECSSVDKMSIRNKLLINNSLENLTKNGYFICNRCKAGIKRKNEFLSNALEYIENVLFGDDDIAFESYDEYINSINEMGNWYVNHVATYESEVDSMVATDEAKSYYENNEITKKGKLSCYPCDYLRQCTGDYTKACDDCVRFVFSCLNNMDKNFINNLSKISKYKWSSISSKSLNVDKNQLQYAMTILGFEIYDVEPLKVDLNYDGYFDFEIFPIDDRFELKKGDILSRDGHLHIYLEENENFGWGKVNNIYPQQTITYIDRTTNNIICSGESFNRVYRYIGEN